MEVILLEKVQNLGNLGDLVRVKPGYARNYLVPKGIATPATEANKAAFEERRKELEKAANEKLQEAQARADKMAGASVEISRKASEEGKLFGSVSTTDIADAMNEAGHELAKSEIHLSEGPLKIVGEHEVAVSLHPEVHFTVVVNVTAEE
jgi:large subunit ribosomal protein L9